MKCKTIALFGVGLFCLRAIHETPHHVLPGESSNNCHLFTGIGEKKVEKTLDFTGIAPSGRRAMAV
jgi:hypothetical protein